MNLGQNGSKGRGSRSREETTPDKGQLREKSTSIGPGGVPEMVFDDCGTAPVGVQTVNGEFDFSS